MGTPRRRVDEPLRVADVWDEARLDPPEKSAVRRHPRELGRGGQLVGVERGDSPTTSIERK
jgi:hypothetical protein